jgi:hypothetical protein
LAPQAQLLIKEQIAAHYDSLQVGGYYPLANSAIDTIAVHYNQQDDITAIIGKVTHRYRAIKEIFSQSKQRCSICRCMKRE